MKPISITQLPFPVPRFSTITTSSYEHTSVLDATLSTSSSSALDLVTSDIPINVDRDNSNNYARYPLVDEDCDPLTFLLVDPSDQSFHFSPSTVTNDRDLDDLFPSNSAAFFEQIHLDQLIRSAQAIESNDQTLASDILSCLNSNLHSPVGPPLQRASFYFKEALQAFLLPLVQDDDGKIDYVADAFSLSLSTQDLVRKISAFKSFSDLSPLPQFCSFTANQSIIDAFIVGDHNFFSRPIHIIDFDIGLGGQWSSFLHEIAFRYKARVGVIFTPPPTVIITAVVVDESLETNLMAVNLRDFAAGLGIRFDIECIRVGGMGPAALGSIRLSTEDNVVISFTPTVTMLLSDGGGGDMVDGFLRFVSRVAPRVVVFVDSESCCGADSSQDQDQDRSFRMSFVAGLEYYSKVLESLDSAAAAVGFDEEQVKRIERALIRPRIRTAVRSWGIRDLPWREMLKRIGFKPLGFSEFTESQAVWLIGRAPIGGFHVARKDGSITMSWQGKEFSSTSAWKF